jgi:hypothetical protein
VRDDIFIVSRFEAEKSSGESHCGNERGDKLQ